MTSGERGDLCGPPSPWKGSLFQKKNGPTSIPPCQSVTDAPFYLHSHSQWAHSLCIQWALCNCWKIHSPPIYGQYAQQKCLQVAYLQLKSEIEASWWCDDGNQPPPPLFNGWSEWGGCAFPSLEETSPRRQGCKDTESNRSRALSSLGFCEFFSISLVFVSLAGAGTPFVFVYMLNEVPDSTLLPQSCQLSLTSTRDFNAHYLNSASSSLQPSSALIHLSVVENGD